MCGVRVWSFHLESLYIIQKRPRRRLCFEHVKAAVRFDLCRCWFLFFLSFLLLRHRQTV